MLPVFLLAFVALTTHSAHHDKFDETIASCTSHCSVTYDADLSCFERTLQFFEKTIVGLMRQYVAVQVDEALIRKSNNLPPYSKAQLLREAEESMAEEIPWYIQDDESMFPVKRAAKIAEVLIDRALSVGARDLLPLACPSGCEKGSSGWLALFLASVAVNLVLCALVVLYTLFLYRRNEMQAGDRIVVAEATRMTEKKDEYNVDTAVLKEEMRQNRKGVQFDESSPVVISCPSSGASGRRLKRKEKKATDSSSGSEKSESRRVGKTRRKEKRLNSEGNCEENVQVSSF